jgi:hypothetical protein
MSDLQTIKNIKIPYATEGVVRTSQLDDTIAPQDSVQLAVNMNFDRVGAIQTRPGVTSYADNLVDAINNYGTLRNAVLPAGYETIFQLGETSEVSGSAFDNPSAVKINSTTIAVFWSGVDNDGFCQKFEVDATTGAITALGTAVEFETSNNNDNEAILVSSSIVLNVWNGVDGDGFARAFNVAADTIVPLSSALEFDTSDGDDFSLAQIDSTHFICFYASAGTGIATVFEVNLGTGAVTEPGSPLTFDAGSVQGISCVALGDGTHFVNFWGAPVVPTAQCFTVNTGTWGITANGTPLTFGTVADKHNAITTGDGEHFVDVYQGATGLLTAQAFNVNLSTFAVTTVGTPFAGSSASDIVATALDGQHFVAFYKGPADGYVQMLEMDSLSFDITAAGTLISGFDFSTGGMSAFTYSTSKVGVIWSTPSSLSGDAAMFQSFGTVVSGRWLYAASGDEVFNTPDTGGVWTSRRSGLAEVSKSRFSQYLNYIWMVNGNPQIGGDPIATSNGGNFGTDLVPEGFPGGDFIHAGFEGRVWVANKTLGIVYYTDIVQFLPPNVYTLTYNSEVNFITTITPQTGESITALYRVPRALLVFTENTITRIYGATSLDAYPAYNVGTFSQESIIETKTGIFFHHSSGFYQFDYGSQPVEISRRIIDFVKAIPRSYYDNITGVWDGFDCIEWNIGQVVVEGVVFANCYVRYTISTQVWTVYDYGFETTANIYYDDGVDLNHLAGTSTGITAALDTGVTDLGNPFYYEYIDRWRSFTEMYYKSKAISEVSVYSENAAGANLMFQVQKSGPNAWQPFNTVTEANNSIIANKTEQDFDVMRFRLVGNTNGAQVVVHGIEIISLTIKGQDEN